jgi:hypothetical protein
MQRRSKIILCALALAASVCAIGARTWFNRAVAAASYVRIADGIYVAPALSDADRRRVLADLHTARDRIAAVYGAPRSLPVTLIAASSSEAARLGLDYGAPGSAFISPAGTLVVLNMAEFSVDVTAHELMHAELADRLGFWTRMIHLPVWFDEGLALQLDWRGPYLVDCAAVGDERIRKVRTLARPGQFWDGNGDQVVANYKAAKCAAAQVLQWHPPRFLYDSLARLGRGESFEDVFRTGTDGMTSRP